MADGEAPVDRDAEGISVDELEPVIEALTPLVSELVEADEALTVDVANVDALAPVEADAVIEADAPVDKLSVAATVAKRDAEELDVEPKVRLAVGLALIVELAVAAALAEAPALVEALAPVDRELVAVTVADLVALALLEMETRVAVAVALLADEALIDAPDVDALAPVEADAVIEAEAPTVRLTVAAAVAKRDAEEVGVEPNVRLAVGLALAVCVVELVSDTDKGTQASSVTPPAAPMPVVVGEPPTKLTALASIASEAFRKEEPPPPPLG